MKKLILFVALLAFNPSWSQTKITTFILLRHAEKENDGSKDPVLTQEGKARATSLAKLFSNTTIDAIYSTSFHRTQSTVEPLAKAKNLTVISYDPKEAVLDGVKQKFKGGTVVICGHSNTIPAMINQLTGHKDEYKTFDDNDYGNLIIVEVAESGGEKVVWMRY